MTQQAAATREVRDLLAGRPGGVNRILKRFSKPLLDYATALIPDRSEPFERMLEDILVDAISQSRAAARAASDEEVFEFVIESALRTVRARYRELLEGDAKPSKATSSYSFKEILARTRMTESELTEGISSGRIRAVRENDQMKVKADGIAGLPERKAHYAFHIPTAERELLCLHYRLGFQPDVIARWSGSTPAQIEEMIGKASNNLAKGMENRGANPDRQDTQIRRYIDGRMGQDETAKFERGIIKDKIAQRRLDELRSQSDGIRELFDSDYYDLSSVAVNVRARNPHHSLSLPPVAALWLQVVGIAAIMLMFHSVGAYLAPPNVKVSALVGNGKLPADGWLSVGEKVKTTDGAQALMVLDDSNRVVLAPNTEVQLLEPREDARQALGVTSGEIWGRFTSAGHAFLVEFPIGEEYSEIASDSGAEFDVVVGEATGDMLPDSLEHERVRVFVAAFEQEGEGLKAARPIKTFANFRAGTELEDDPGIKTGDRIENIDGIVIRNREDLAGALRTLATDESLQLTVGRGDERIAMPLTRLDTAPGAVVRVFHGALMAGPRGGERVLVNRGQWALFTPGQQPLVGLRGLEDFRLLRIDADGRFKDRLHWLNTQSYPLRAENNLLVVERALRGLAQGLENIRAEDIRRDGPREIRAFESVMRESIAAAKDRIAQKNPREGGPGVESLSDEALVASEDEILGTIEHWRRQSATGVYPTLGDAAKTLKSPILRYRDELEARGEELTRSLLLQEDIKLKDNSIGIQDADIAELQSSDFYDADGSKRAELDVKINDLDKQVKAGADAAGRKEMIMVKLNALDEKIDNQRRKLPGHEKSVAGAERALETVNSLLAANIYTAGKLGSAEAAVASAETELQAARSARVTAAGALTAAELAHADADKALKEAKKPLLLLVIARDDAENALTEAVTQRSNAQVALDEATAEVERLQAELDALSEEDPNRAAKQEELDAARKVATEAQTTLDAAAQAAKEANDALDAAAGNLKAGEDLIAKRESELSAAAATRDAAITVRDDRDSDVKSADSALKQANDTLKAQQDAKAARAILETRKSEAESELTTAKADLAAVEAKLAELEEQAAPQREKMNVELAVMKKAEEARKLIEETRTERGRYQAISDDIAGHAKDRQLLITERDQLANSNLVMNYDTLRQEYEALSRRIDAFEFLSARGIMEDKNFGHEQKAAQDRFREAAEAATAQALEVLERWCPRYQHEAYSVFEGESGSKLRPAVLDALWRLYYDTGLNGGSDGKDTICYYVAVQSGAGADVFAALDNRWQAYLTEALGRTGFEALAEITPASLQPPTKMGVAKEGE